MCDHWNAFQAARRQGLRLYPARCTRTHLVEEIRIDPPGTPSGAQRIVLAGRVTAVGDSGFRLADASGSVWLQVPRQGNGATPGPEGLTVPAPIAAQGVDTSAGEDGPDMLAPETLLPLLVPGDVVQAEVEVPGEPWWVRRLGMLAKARRPAPWLLSTPTQGGPGGGATLDTLVHRAQILRAIRSFFDTNGFLEVETPIMARHPGMEPHIDLFESRYRPDPTLPGTPVFLLSSPEYAMKRLVAAGVERVYQVSRVFRNGELGPFHNPEFTLLEWYRAFASFVEIQADLERLVQFIADRLRLGGAIRWQGHTVSLASPWPRITVREAVSEATGLDLASLGDDQDLVPACRRIGVDVPSNATWDEAFSRLLADRVEPTLGLERPVFLMDYPARLAALAKVRHDSYPVAERFELYVAGMEVANAYTELNDPDVQRERFLQERAMRRRMGAPAFDFDPDYLETLESGLPPCGGIALGVDRLIMLLLDLPDVRKAMAFPFSASTG